MVLTDCRRFSKPADDQSWILQSSVFAPRLESEMRSSVLPKRRRPKPDSAPTSHRPSTTIPSTSTLPVVTAAETVRAYSVAGADSERHHAHDEAELDQQYSSPSLMSTMSAAQQDLKAELRRECRARSHRCSGEQHA